MELSGQIVRIVPSMGLVYLAAPDTGEVYSFGLDRLESYRGESLHKHGIKIGACVAFRTNPDGRVIQVAEPGQALTNSSLAAGSAH